MSDVVENCSLFSLKDPRHCFQLVQFRKELDSFFSAEPTSCLNEEVIRPIVELLCRLKVDQDVKIFYDIFNTKCFELFTAVSRFDPPTFPVRIVKEIHFKENDLRDYEKLSDVNQFGFMRIKHRETNKKYFFKVVNKITVSELKCAEQLRAEYKASTSCHHLLHNIVYSYNNLTNLCWFYEDTQHSIVSLLSPKGRLPLEQIRYYMPQLVVAVQKLHEMNIVHRSIHLEKILLNSHGNIKLSGFECAGTLINGINIITQRDNFTNNGFFAPELVQGLNDLHNHSSSWAVITLDCDLWSLGVVAHSFLFGSLPFDDWNEESLVKYESLVSAFQQGLSRTWINQEFCQLLCGLLAKPGSRLEGERLRNIPLFHEVKWDNVGHSPAPFVENLRIVEPAVLSSPISLSQYDICEQEERLNLMFSFLGYSYDRRQSLTLTAFQFDIEDGFDDFLCCLETLVSSFEENMVPLFQSIVGPNAAPKFVCALNVRHFDNLRNGLLTEIVTVLRRLFWCLKFAVVCLEVINGLHLNVKIGAVKDGFNIVVTALKSLQVKIVGMFRKNDEGKKKCEDAFDHFVQNMNIIEKEERNTCEGFLDRIVNCYFSLALNVFTTYRRWIRNIVVPQDLKKDKRDVFEISDFMAYLVRNIISVVSGESNIESPQQVAAKFLDWRESALRDFSMEISIVKEFDEKFTYEIQAVITQFEEISKRIQQSCQERFYIKCCDALNTDNYEVEPSSSRDKSQNSNVSALGTKDLSSKMKDSGSSTKPSELQFDEQKTALSGVQNTGTLRPSKFENVAEGYQIRWSRGTNTELPYAGKRSTNTELPNAGIHSANTDLLNGRRHATNTELPNSGIRRANTDLPNARRHSTDTELPNAGIRRANTDLPNARRHSTNTELPNAGIRRANTDLPNARRHSTNTELPNAGIRCANTDLPNAKSHATNTELPNSGIRRANTDLPNAKRHSINIELPNAGIRRTNTDLPNAKSHTTNTELPNSDIRRANTDLPNARRHSTNTELPNADEVNTIDNRSETKPVTPSKLQFEQIDIKEKADLSEVRNGTQEIDPTNPDLLKDVIKMVLENQKRGFPSDQHFKKHDNEEEAFTLKPFKFWINTELPNTDVVQMDRGSDRIMAIPSGLPFEKPNVKKEVATVSPETVKNKSKNYKIRRSVSKNTEVPTVDVVKMVDNKSGTKPVISSRLHFKKQGCKKQDGPPVFKNEIESYIERNRKMTKRLTKLADKVKIISNAINDPEAVVGLPNVGQHAEMVESLTDVSLKLVFPYKQYDVIKEFKIKTIDKQPRMKEVHMRRSSCPYNNKQPSSEDPAIQSDKIDYWQKIRDPNLRHRLIAPLNRSDSASCSACRMAIIKNENRFKCVRCNDVLHEECIGKKMFCKKIILDNPHTSRNRRNSARCWSGFLQFIGQRRYKHLLFFCTYENETLTLYNPVENVGLNPVKSLLDEWKEMESYFIKICPNTSDRCSLQIKFYDNRNLIKSYFLKSASVLEKNLLYYNLAKTLTDDINGPPRGFPVSPGLTGNDRNASERTIEESFYNDDIHDIGSLPVEVFHITVIHADVLLLSTRNGFLLHKNDIEDVYLVMRNVVSVRKFIYLPSPHQHSYAIAEFDHKCLKLIQVNSEDIVSLTEQQLEDDSFLRLEYKTYFSCSTKRCYNFRDIILSHDKRYLAALLNDSIMVLKLNGVGAVETCSSYNFSGATIHMMEILANEDQQMLVCFVCDAFYKIQLDDNYTVIAASFLLRSNRMASYITEEFLRLPEAFLKIQLLRSGVFMIVVNCKVFFLKNEIRPNYAHLAINPRKKLVDVEVFGETIRVVTTSKIMYFNLYLTTASDYVDVKTRPKGFQDRVLDVYSRALCHEIVRPTCKIIRSGDDLTEDFLLASINVHQVEFNYQLSVLFNKGILHHIRSILYSYPEVKYVFKS